MKPVLPVIPGIELPITEYATNQDEYITLPCFRQSNGSVMTRWKLTLVERIEIFLTGNLWLQVLTFNKPLQPIKLSTTIPVIEIHEVNVDAH